MTRDARLAAIRRRLSANEEHLDITVLLCEDMPYLLARIEALERARSEAIKAVDTAIYLANGNAWPSQIVKALDTAMTVLQAGKEA